jgi:hypothetical protein
MTLATGAIHSELLSNSRIAEGLRRTLTEGNAVAVPVNGAMVTGRIKSWVYVLETETTV